MSVNVTLYQHASVVVDTDLKEFGSRAEPQTITVDGMVYETRATITNTAVDNYNRQVLWQDGQGGISDFDVLVFESDTDCLLELTIDRAGTPAYCLVQIEADIPFLLSSDDMLAAIATDGSAESMDQIDQIAVKNDSDGTAADVSIVVHLLLIT